MDYLSIPVRYQVYANFALQRQVKEEKTQPAASDHIIIDIAPEELSPKNAEGEPKAVSSRKCNILKGMGVALMTLAAMAAAGWASMHLDKMQSALSKALDIGRSVFSQGRSYIDQSIETAGKFVAQHINLDSLKGVEATHQFAKRAL